MKIKRKIFDNDGKLSTEDRILEMDIKPGLKKGSKIKYKGVGDQIEGGQQDLHFIVEEVSHNHPFTLSDQTSNTNSSNRKNTQSSLAMVTI